MPSGRHAPLASALRAEVLAHAVLHADETPLVLLRPKRTAYAWVYLGDAANPFTLFDLTPGTSGAAYEEQMFGNQGLGETLVLPKSRYPFVAVMMPSFRSALTTVAGLSRIRSRSEPSGPTT
mgnify:CR=1 FL=1